VSARCAAAIKANPNRIGLTPNAHPEVVIQRIADFRSEDKDDPNYYARHTVKKAIAEIGVQSSGATPMLHSEERDNREPGH
jgi:hypothetical protein